MKEHERILGVYCELMDRLTDASKTYLEDADIDPNKKKALQNEVHSVERSIDKMKRNI